jgi:hypothetical protein
MNIFRYENRKCRANNWNDEREAEDEETGVNRRIELERSYIVS